MAEEISPLAVLQATYSLLRLEGAWFVVDHRKLEARHGGPGPQDLEFCKRGPEADLLLRRELESAPAPCSSTGPVIQQFLISPETHVFTRLAFSPRDQGPEVLNFWCPPTVQPSPGDWGVLRAFIEEVICGRDVAMARYLLHFLAHMLQRPEEKPGVMIILLGGQGTGKGMFFNLLNAIWGHSTLRVSSVEQVVGRFNAALERAYVVCMDEALFRGDKKNTERLKSMITEEVLHVEQKHQPSRNIDSVHRFFAASNSDHFAHVEADDRRMVYVRVSAERQQDLHYFGCIDRAIRDPQIVGAMVHDLMALDLTGFQVRERPRTPELARQKLLSLTGFERYWFEVLSSGAFGRYAHLLEPQWNEEYRFVASEDLLDRWREHDRNAARFDPPQINDLYAKMRRVCPSAQKDRSAVAGRGQHRGFLLPPLSVARREFEKFIGDPVDWPHPHSADETPPVLEPATGEAACVAHAVFAKIMAEVGVRLPTVDA